MSRLTKADKVVTLSFLDFSAFSLGPLGPQLRANCFRLSFLAGKSKKLLTALLTPLILTFKFNKEVKLILEKKKTFNSFAASKGLRSTRQRDIILDIFLSTHQHLSVEDLYLKVKSSYPGIGQATVYRTLKLFAEAGLAREILLHDGQTRYEHVGAGEHHDHLVCTQCSTIVEFENETIEQLQQEIASRHGFMIRSHKLEIYGLCAACRGA
jgi:Fur family transcriptional regulator, ferric uptake regulator